jgi:hypothetical protein
MQIHWKPLNAEVLKLGGGGAGVRDPFWVAKSPGLYYYVRFSPGVGQHQNRPRTATITVV